MSEALQELLPMDLNTVARNLGVDPVEGVRLLVASGHDVSSSLDVPASLVETLRDQAGIEASWWSDADASEPKARVQALLQKLLERGLIGDATTRMDNCWRGLSDDDQDLIEQAVQVLVEEKVLRCVGTPMGLHLSVDADMRAAAEGLSTGSSSLDALDELYGE